MAEEPNQPFCLHRRFSLPSTLSPNGRLKVEKEEEKKEGFLLLHFPLKKEGKERVVPPPQSRERVQDCGKKGGRKGAGGRTTL